MFDIGGWEFLIVIVIAIIVIGPKDLPGAIRTVSGWIRRARELARDFQSGLDDLARETDMDNVKNEIQSGLGLDDIAGAGNSIRGQIEETIDPGGNIKGAFKEDLPPVDDDGPFADNSFEEDEDIDGADPDDAAGEEDIKQAQIDVADVANKDDPAADEKTSAEAAKKADT